MSPFDVEQFTLPFDTERGEAKPQPGDARAESVDTATNAPKPVGELVRPHLRTGKCLIATGYQDLFSSLAIILQELDQIEPDPDQKIRIVYGIDTSNARGFAGRGRPAPEEARRFYMRKAGLLVEDAADLSAVLAIEAIRSGRIDIRVYDSRLAAQHLGVSGERLLHAKLVVSDEGALAGSANFSRSGLYRNIEYSDTIRTGDGRTNESRRNLAYLEEQRRRVAEAIWDSGEDWNAAALEILERLLKPVSAQEAVARAIAEMKTFSLWAPTDETSNAPYPLMPYQVEMTMESCYMVYEHGYAMVCAPTGSGKTDIGTEATARIAETARRIDHSDAFGSRTRGGSLVVCPARVRANWEGMTCLNFQVVSADTVSRFRGLENVRGMTIDESHNVMPDSQKESKRARSIEMAPAAFTLFLSATPVGNQDIDSIAYQLETRGSLFAEPNFQKRMRELHDEEAERIKHLPARAEYPMSDETRADLARLLAPCMSIRTRADVGESSDRSSLGTYPPFTNHGRPSEMTLSPSEARTVGELVKLTNDLAPGDNIASIQVSRFGHRSMRHYSRADLCARNLLNLARSSSALASWQIEHGVIGRQLREFERKQASKAMNPKGAKKGKSDKKSASPSSKIPTPITDKIESKLRSSAFRRIDQRRVEVAYDIQKRHRRVIFLAESVDVLELFAERLYLRAQHDLLAARKREQRGGAPVDVVVHQNVVIASNQGSRPVDEEGRIQADMRRAVQSLTGGKTHFTRVNSGAKGQEWFAEGGDKSPKGPASAFLTYAMAEGINLQSADALVLLGATSNIRELIQGLGRNSRVDSLHEMIHYYLIDIPVGSLASDKKAQARLETYRTLVGQEHMADHAADVGDTEAMLASVFEHLRARRILRENNFHDVLSMTRELIPAETYEMVSSLGAESSWTAQLAMLRGSTPFTIVQLRGYDGSSPEHGGRCAPPRFLMIDDNGYIERNQIACARALHAAYRETMDMGLDGAATPKSGMLRAIPAIQRVRKLREWDLRPERMISLLSSLAVFLSGENDDLGWGHVDDGEEVPLDERMFGDLSLAGLEDLCAAWARHLDIFWRRTKEDVRESLKSGERAHPYISFDEVIGHLHADPVRRDVILKKMQAAFEHSKLRAVAKPNSIADRVSVVFVSDGTT